MEEQLSQGFIIMVIGMATVFLVLFLVTVTGKVLIWAVNTLTTEEKEPRISGRAITAKVRQEKDQAKIAAIIAAVDVVTAGKGRIEKIERIS